MPDTPEALESIPLLRRQDIGKTAECLRVEEEQAGGGNVAMDVVRTAIRVGAEEAYIVYRRSADEMPADKEEVAEAIEEGVKFCYLNAPVEILGDKNGKVNGLKVEIMELGEPDEKGKRKPVGTGKFTTIKVNSVIGAIGQQIDWGELDTGAMVSRSTLLSGWVSSALFQTCWACLRLPCCQRTSPKCAATSASGKTLKASRNKRSASLKSPKRLL